MQLNNNIYFENDNTLLSINKSSVYSKLIKIEFLITLKFDRFTRNGVTINVTPSGAFL